MNRQLLLPWNFLDNTWRRCLFLQPNMVIGVVCKNTKMRFGEAELYLGIGIPFKYEYVIHHPWPQQYIYHTMFSLSIKYAMNRCDQELQQLGYTLLSAERAEKLSLLL